MYPRLQPESPITNRSLLLMGAALGFLYGLTIRVLPLILPRHRSGVEVMSISFTCLMPFAVGFITSFYSESKARQPVWRWLILPWLPIVAALAATLLLLLEGFICVLFFAPLALILSSLGGLFGGLAARGTHSHYARSLSLAWVMVLPFLVNPWEGRVFHQLEIRSVQTAIDIAAPPEVIWRNIERVSAITPSELPFSWSRQIGFPAPVEATLSYEGVGGVRNASFAGGVLFIETVEVWQPQHRLAFSIRADRIPPKTLDEHVRVGGPYFDVLRGEYRLEPLPNGKTRLHLSSWHRLSTDFNWYAHFWTDAVMSDLQHTILQVIAHRCEMQVAAGTSF
jgi:hypothetical protein